MLRLTRGFELSLSPRTDQLVIGQPLTKEQRSCQHEPLGIVIEPGIEPEALFVKVAIEMEGFDVDVRALESSLH